MVYRYIREFILIMTNILKLNIDKTNKILCKFGFSPIYARNQNDVIWLFACYKNKNYLKTKKILKIIQVEKIEKLK